MSSAPVASLSAAVAGAIVGPNVAASAPARSVRCRACRFGSSRSARSGSHGMHAVSSTQRAFDRRRLR